MKNLLFTTALVAGLLFGAVPSAHAQGDDPDVSSTQQYADPTIKNVRVTKYKHGVNRPCPEMSDKMFILDVTMSDDSVGTFVDSDDAFALITLRSGLPVIDTDMFLNSLDGYRTASYYLYTDNRRAQVRKKPAWNSATVKGSSPEIKYTASLRMDCQEYIEEQ
jgi:hypothetical protein